MFQKKEDTKTCGSNSVRSWTNFQNYFTGRIPSKFALKMLLKIQPPVPCCHITMWNIYVPDIATFKNCISRLPYKAKTARHHSAAKIAGEKVLIQWYENYLIHWQKDICSVSTEKSTKWSNICSCCNRGRRNAFAHYPKHSFSRLWCR